MPRKPGAYQVVDYQSRTLWLVGLGLDTLPYNQRVRVIAAGTLATSHFGNVEAYCPAWNAGATHAISMQAEAGAVRCALRTWRTDRNHSTPCEFWF